MTKKTVRTIFIAVMIWLPLQYGIVGIVGYYHSEPWPAFVFPGFKSVYVYEDSFEIEQSYIEVWTEQGEQSVRLLPQEFFPDLPLSQVPGFMRTHFLTDEEERQFSIQAKRWLHQQAGRAAGLDAAMLDIVLEVNYYSHHPHGLERDSVAEKMRYTINLIDQDEHQRTI